jgi:hypothetical protein
VGLAGRAACLERKTAGLRSNTPAQSKATSAGLLNAARLVIANTQANPDIGGRAASSGYPAHTMAECRGLCDAQAALAATSHTLMGIIFIIPATGQPERAWHISPTLQRRVAPVGRG